MNLTSPIEGGGLPPKKKFRGSTEGDFRRGGEEGNFLCPTEGND